MYGTVNSSALLVLSTVVHAKAIYSIVCMCLSIQCPTGAREPPAHARRWPFDPDAAEPSSAATASGIGKQCIAPAAISREILSGVCRPSAASKAARQANCLCLTSMDSFMWRLDFSNDPMERISLFWRLLLGVAPVDQ